MKYPISKPLSASAFVLSVVALLVLNTHAQVTLLQPLITFGTNGDGSLRPGDLPYLSSSSQLQRGLAYNPTTGHLLLVDRSTNSSANNDVHILDGNTGAYINKLDNSSTLAGGNAAFTLNMVGVADDGAIYVCNLSSSSSGTPQVRLYRWADESSPQTLVSPTPSFPADDPSNGNTNAAEKRWGDTMVVRGSGLNTQILLANRGTLACLYTPDDISYSHFTPKTLATDVATGGIGWGLSFGGGNTFWGTSGANGNGPLLHLSFNAIAGTATTLTNFASPAIAGTISPILVVPASNLLAGITMVSGADVVRLFDISNSNNPVLMDRKSFVTANPNNNFVGSVTLGTNGVLYALDADNGIMAYALSNAASSTLPPEFFLNPASAVALVTENITFNSGADSAQPILYQWLRFGTNFSADATNASLTLTNLQVADSGDYSVVASNSLGSVTSAVAVLTVNLAPPRTVWNLAVGGTWNAGSSWNPTTIPGVIGAYATFNSAASSSNLAQTANRTINLDVDQTVGSITFNNDAATAFTTTIANGTAGSLTFDEYNSGTATINVPAVAGTGNATISGTMTNVDNVVATVNNVTASSAAGALNLTGAIRGPGGFTKLGDGLATFGTGAKTYQGPTVLGGGRIRISQAAHPSATSSLTINAGGQLEMITAGTYTYGSAPINLNGSGAVTGPFAAFPGAIRPSRGIAITVNNAVVLQSDSMIHVQANAGTGTTASPVGSTTLAGVISGPGRLTFTAPNSDVDQGVLILNGANTYAGGTLVNGGILEANGVSATFGTGNVTVDHAASPSSIARVRIRSGVTNAIADSATLSLSGGRTAGVADEGWIILESGVNEVVGMLKLGGAIQPAGTYGSSSSSATFQSDEFFEGPGMLTVLSPVALTITLAPPNVVLSWPTIATGYQLQAVGTLTGTWTNDNTTVVVSGPNNTVTEPIGTTKFFRLKK